MFIITFAIFFFNSISYYFYETSNSFLLLTQSIAFLKNKNFLSSVSKIFTGSFNYLLDVGLSYDLD